MEMISSRCQEQQPTLLGRTASPRPGDPKPATDSKPEKPEKPAGKQRPFCHLGFPKFRGTILGGPHNKDHSISESILGSPYLGELPFNCCRECGLGECGRDR